MTPLLEVLPKDQERMLSRLEGRWGRLAEHLASARNTLPVYVDMRNPTLDALGEFLSCAKLWTLHVIPVVPLDRVTPDKVRQITPSLRHGMAARITEGDLPTAALDSFIGVADDSGVPLSELHLIVDAGVVTNSDPEAALSALNSVPDVKHWESITLLGGAFPKNLTDYKPGVHRISRREWHRWKSVTQRWPAQVLHFGDYTTQHAIYKDPPPGANPSASIRYTLESEWLVFRGEGIRNPDSAGTAQWPGNAMLLVDMPEFQGESCCEGDRYIRDRASNPERTGNAHTWLRATVNHHLTQASGHVANWAGTAKSL